MGACDSAAVTFNEMNVDKIARPRVFLIKTDSPYSSHALTSRSCDSQAANASHLGGTGTTRSFRTAPLESLRESSKPFGKLRKTARPMVGLHLGESRQRLLYSLRSIVMNVGVAPLSVRAKRA